MLKFVAWMYWMSISKEKNTYSCIPSGKRSHSDGWNIPMFNRNYIFNPGPFSRDCYVSLLDCSKQMLCGPCLHLHIQFSRTSTLFQLLLFRDLIWSSHQCMIVNAWHHIRYFQYTGWSQLDITGYSILFVCQNQLSNEQNPGWLGYTQGGIIINHYKDPGHETTSIIERLNSRILILRYESAALFRVFLAANGDPPCLAAFFPAQAVAPMPRASDLATQIHQKYPKISFYVTNDSKKWSQLESLPSGKLT